MTALIRDCVREALARALERAQAEDALPPVPASELRVERPQNPEHGDYASNVALRLAGAAKRRPLEVAEAIAERVEADDLIAAVEIAAPGFINVWLSTEWKRAQVDEILEQGAEYGQVEIGGGAKLQVEFVSANPTGPLQVGNGRGAVLGDTLANVLAAAGYDVQREYYINDGGSQIRLFGDTLYARYQQALGREAALPEDGYQGQYMIELAQGVADDAGDRYLQADGEAAPTELTDLGLERMVERIREDLALISVEFNEWFRERSLYAANGDASAYETAMGRLREGGFVVEKEDAVWFRSDALGEDKDNVLVRRTGEPTYFASDIAYHFNKFVTRGFERVIDVWGSDHQGHVARTKAAVAAVGADAAGLEILLYQLVHLRRGKERVRMSKRTGEIVTLRELVEDVGSDVSRFFLLQRSADAQMDFDLELASSQDPKQNPVSYVQYAHARCASILRAADEAGLAPDGDVQLLGEPPEQALVATALKLPELIADMAHRMEPHHLTTYALELAQQFTGFYEVCRVVDPEQPELSRARLKLTLAAKTVIARVLTLIGVSAPESM